MGTCGDRNHKRKEKCRKQSTPRGHAAAAGCFSPPTQAACGRVDTASCASAASGAAAGSPLDYFNGMLQRCHEYATQTKRAGRPVVGILCEFTPREVILAAGAVPVCLCGGSARTIPAAERELSANLCPLIKSTYGYHVQGSNPFLEMADLVVAETTCDGKKKMYELMGRTRPMHVLELPQKPDRCRCPRTLGQPGPRAQGPDRAAIRRADHRLQAARGDPADEPRAAAAATAGGGNEGRRTATDWPAADHLQEQHLGHFRRPRGV